MEVFVEQPLASPGSAKYYSTFLLCINSKFEVEGTFLGT